MSNETKHLQVKFRDNVPDFSDKMNNILPVFTSRFVYRFFALRNHTNAAIYCCSRLPGRALCSSASEKEQQHKERVKEELKSYLNQHRVRLKDTEQRIKNTGNVIIKDIKETKDKVKVRVGEIIEVKVIVFWCFYYRFGLFRFIFRKKMCIQYRICCVFQGFCSLRIWGC